MLPKDFVEFVEGYNKRLTDQHEIARRQAYFAMAPHLSKPITIGKFNKDYWPLPGDSDGEQDRKQRLIEKLKRLKANGNGTSSNRDTSEPTTGVKQPEAVTG